MATNKPDAGRETRSDAAYFAFEAWLLTRSGELTDRELLLIGEAFEAGFVAASSSHVVARELGARGCKIGGLARAASLTPARRSEIARRAALARWSVKPLEGGDCPANSETTQ